MKNSKNKSKISSSSAPQPEKAGTSSETAAVQVQSEEGDAWQEVTPPISTAQVHTWLSLYHSQRIPRTQ